MNAEQAMALHRAQSACFQRHRRTWDRSVPDGEEWPWTAEQIRAVRHAFKVLSEDLDECDPHTVLSDD